MGEQIFFAWEEEMQIIKFMLEYGSFPIWTYNESNELIENDFPEQLSNNKELDTLFTDIQNVYDSLFQNDKQEFKYIGFPDQSKKSNFINKIHIAIKKIESALSSDCKLLVDEGDVFANL